MGATAALTAGCGGHSSAARSETPRNDPGPFRSIAVHVTLTPSRAGSLSRPQAARLRLRVTLGAPRKAEPPALDQLIIRLPQGTRYNGAGFPSCPQRTLTGGGPDACPRGSLMGTGMINARADTAPAPGQVTVVNGGAQRLYLYATIDHPVRVRAPIVGTITRQAAPWAYRLRLVVPRQLQVVAGIPIALRELEVDAGRGSWLTTTSCPPSGRWAFAAQAGFAGAGDAAQTATAPCS
jgi:hypothetical protein